MTRAKPVIEEAFIYLVVLMFFGILTAGAVAHRHGDHCGNPAHHFEEAKK